MAYTYFSFQPALAVEMALPNAATAAPGSLPTTFPNFGAILPTIIDYAEQRCYRELDLLFTQTVDATKQVSSGVREFTVSSAIGAFIYAVLCQVFDKQDDKRREYLTELAEFFRLLATDENAHLHHDKSRPTLFLNPSKPPEV